MTTHRVRLFSVGPNVPVRSLLVGLQQRVRCPDYRLELEDSEMGLGRTDVYVEANFPVPPSVVEVLRGEREWK